MDFGGRLRDDLNKGGAPFGTTQMADPAFLIQLRRVGLGRIECYRLIGLMLVMPEMRGRLALFQAAIGRRRRKRELHRQEKD